MLTFSEKINWFCYYYISFVEFIQIIGRFLGILINKHRDLCRPFFSFLVYSKSRQDPRKTFRLFLSKNINKLAVWTRARVDFWKKKKNQTVFFGFIGTKRCWHKVLNGKGFFFFYMPPPFMTCEVVALHNFYPVQG